MLASDVPSCFKPWKETVTQPDRDIRVCYFHDQAEWAVLNVLQTKDLMSILNSETIVGDNTINQQLSPISFQRGCFCEGARLNLSIRIKSRNSS